MILPGSHSEQFLSLSVYSATMVTLVTGAAPCRNFIKIELTVADI